VHEERHLAC